jgi:cyclophilin family peptidyl-prolyl cis-trans isomerase
MKLFKILICLGLFLVLINAEQRSTTAMTATANPQVIIKTTAGDIILELYPDKAPVTVQNFLTYVDEGFYSGTIFHRVIKNFMIQGGGLTEDLADKTNKHEPIVNEANNGLSNQKGTIAMARTMVVDSATSQFFINVVDNNFLDYKNATPQGYGYCVFGKVLKGMDVVESIRQVRTQTIGGHQDVPVEKIEIISAARLEPQQ